LATLALILPNFAEAAAGPSYSILQLEGIGLMSLVLWCVFVFVQTVSSTPQATTIPTTRYMALRAC